MAVFRFYGLVLREAVRHSLDIAQSIIFVLLAIGGSVVALYPASKAVIETFDLGGWKIATTTLGSIIAVRLFCAPYWIWKASQTPETDLLLSLESNPVFGTINDVEGNEIHNGVMFCVCVTNSGETFLRNCQITFGFKDQRNYPVTAPFDLRQGESRDLRVLSVKSTPLETRAIVHIFGPDDKKIPVNSPAWLPKPGTYQIKALSADTKPAMLDVELLRTDAGWSLASCT